MSTIPETLFSVQRHRLLVLVREGRPEQFKAAFIAAVQHWAKEFGFATPMALSLEVTVDLIGWAGGGTAEQVTLLLRRIGIELSCPVIDNVKRDESLGDMATFCYEYLRR